VTPWGGDGGLRQYRGAGGELQRELYNCLWVRMQIDRNQAEVRSMSKGFECANQSGEKRKRAVAAQHFGH
jgi:hypothetical protein